MTPDEIINSKGSLLVDPTGSIMSMASWDDFKDFTGLCKRGPHDGFTLSASKPIVKMNQGAYRHLDGRWWWTPLA